MCEEVVNIYIMDSAGKGHSSNKKFDQPGIYAILSYFLHKELLIMKLTGEEGHTHTLRPHCKPKWNKLG